MTSSRPGRLILGVACALVCALGAPAYAAASHGVFQVRPGSFRVAASSRQAGAHADVTTTFAFTEGSWRNADVVLPLGFAGYPPAVKTCNPVQLILVQCPVGSQVGTLEITLNLGKAFGVPNVYDVLVVPVFNMLPSPNQTAVYGYNVGKVTSAVIVISVGPEYRVHAKVSDIESAFEITRQSLTIWGVPAAESHNARRLRPGAGWVCGAQVGPSEVLEESESCSGGGEPSEENRVPYLVNPSQCSTSEEALRAEVRGVTDWQGEEAEPATTSIPPFEHCSYLKFPPTLSVAPEVSQATSPTGYSVDLGIPQSEGAEGLGTSDLKDAVVTLPVGAVLSPAAANGLVFCSEAQVGLGTEQPVECPNASKLAEVSLVTPALTGEMKGFLFLGGPPAGMIRKPPFTVYLTLAGHGVLMKIRGTVMLNPVTGQITTVFDENPELPFSELRLQLNGGSRATVANPHTCGAYRAQSVFTPWSSPFVEDVFQLSQPFEISGCQAPRFAPSFAAGTTSNQAGGYSPLDVTFSREDADQELGGLTVTMPPGIAGNISKVALCPEPQAAEGTCPESSQIGELIAGAGPGPEPLYIPGGKVFLTGPYEGAPFGLSIDVSEKAGPIDLGSGPCDCEVVRATVNINPVTSQITVSNGALPTGKDGIPFQVKSVHVIINRPEFTFNPTNCQPLSVEGTLSSVKDTLAQVSNRFQATNCGALGFKPTFSVATSGRTSRTEGASLTAKLSYPNVGGHSILASGLANIAKVKVELPKQLPSRLTTLQKACPDTVFDQNPANCPAASRIGSARATTPILPVALIGPAFFVSHGGAKFPELIIVLQGDGVTVDLHGETFINKAGITSTSFNTVPDVPVGNFELVLPEGPYSALAANGDVCASKLTMPTVFTAQDGTVIKQNSPIAVSGCKPQIRVIRHRVRGSRATVQVSVPSPGTLVAHGAGVRRTTRTIARAGEVTLALGLSAAEQRFLARHRGRRLQVPITFSFAPAHGRLLQARVAVLMK